ncbi:MAG: hypothetical protein WB777_20715 [Mycobacterium sp.]
MASSTLSPRYERDQQVALAGLVALLIVITAMASWAYCKSSARQADSVDSAAAPSASTMPEWLAESEPSINALVDARQEIAAAAAKGDLAATGAACRTAAGAAAHLHRQMPSPAPALTTTLQRALSSYDLGLPYCISATQANDGHGLQRAANYITEGDAVMRVAIGFLGHDSGPEPASQGVLIV